MKQTKNYFRFLLVVLSVMLVVACSRSDDDNDESNTDLMPNVTGTANEVLVVMEDTYWEGRMGDSLKAILMQPLPGLPQDEPLFSLVQIPGGAFSKVFHTHRNILRTTINKELEKPKMTVKQNVWAKPQMYILLEGADAIEVLNLVYANKEKLINYLTDAETSRLVDNYRRYEEVSIRQRIEEKHHLKLSAPKGYTIGADYKDFTWISYEPRDILQGVFIYEYPYTDTLDIEPKEIIARRDSFLKLHVPGPTEGSYMNTEKLLPVVYDEFLFNDRYTVELRGLWRVENDFMGGPFVSLTRVDTKRNRVIVTDAYVYAPAHEKRNYLRQVEGILYTTEIVEKPEE